MTTVRSAQDEFLKQERQQKSNEKKRAWQARKRQRPDRFYRELISCMNKRRRRDSDDRSVGF